MGMHDLRFHERPTVVEDIPNCRRKGTCRYLWLIFLTKNIEENRCPFNSRKYFQQRVRTSKWLNQDWNEHPVFKIQNDQTDRHKEHYHHQNQYHQIHRNPFQYHYHEWLLKGGEPTKKPNLKDRTKEWLVCSGNDNNVLTNMQGDPPPQKKEETPTWKKKRVWWVVGDNIKMLERTWSKTTNKQQFDLQTAMGATLK